MKKPQQIVDKMLEADEVDHQRYIDALPPAMSRRMFYRTKITVDVLSEDPINETPSLSDLDFMITEGGCSGVVKMIASKALNGRQTARALLSQGSAPSFFQLDPNGNDLNQDD